MKTFREYLERDFNKISLMSKEMLINFADDYAEYYLKEKLKEMNIIKTINGKEVLRIVADKGKLSCKHCIEYKKQGCSHDECGSGYFVESKY